MILGGYVKKNRAARFARRRGVPAKLSHHRIWTVRLKETKASTFCHRAFSHLFEILSVTYLNHVGI
jgi:hypothetical protein